MEVQGFQITRGRVSGSRISLSTGLTDDTNVVKVDTVKAVATLQTTHLPTAGGDVVKSQSELTSSQSQEDIRVKFIQYYDEIYLSKYVKHFCGKGMAIAARFRICS